MTIQVNGLQFDTGVNGILGPHGVGKTRLLQKMAAKDTSVEWAHQEQSAKVSYVTRESEAFEARTVQEYLQQATEHDLNCRHAAAASIESALERVHLTRYANVRIADLPKIAKTQTLIAKAMICDPQYMLLDDVLYGLTHEERQYIGYLLSQLGQDRVIVLAGTVGQSVEGLFDTVCLLHPDKEAVQIPVNTAFSWVEGKVWEYIAPEVPELDDRLVSYVKHSTDGVFVREIAACKPYEEVSQVSPTLGDAYLWWSKQ